MNRFFTLLLAASCLTAVGQVTYPYNPDGNNDGYISLNDLLDLLSVYGSEFDAGVLPTSNHCVLDGYDANSAAAQATRYFYANEVCDNYHFKFFSQSSRTNYLFLPDSTFQNRQINVFVRFGGTYPDEGLAIIGGAGWGGVLWGCNNNNIGACASAYGSGPAMEAGLWMIRFAFDSSNGWSLLQGQGHYILSQGDAPPQ